MDADSSLFIRVAQFWTGNGWGALFHPRIGQEVVVDFLEGNPDHPLITGCLYHGDNKPPYPLPDEGTKSTIKTNSSPGGGGFNEFRFQDKKGKEQVFLHGQKDLDIRVKETRKETIGGSSHLIVGGSQFEKVGGDKHLTVKGGQNEKVDGDVMLTAANLIQKIDDSIYLDAGGSIYGRGKATVVFGASTGITLKVGGNFITIDPSGIYIQGTVVMINSGGAALPGVSLTPVAPKEPAAADKGDPGEKAEVPPPKRPPKPESFSPQAVALQQAAIGGAPFCDT
jgi:type VI secretion system secreted protein VgrG